MTANTQYSQMMDCVIIRDETVATSESTARVEYIATENTLVNEGDTIANVYTAGYSESLLQKLEDTRAKIQDYHKNTILKNIKDADLERYDTIVDMMVLEFKHLVNRESRGSQLTAARQQEKQEVKIRKYVFRNDLPDRRAGRLDRRVATAAVQPLLRLRSAQARFGVCLQHGNLPPLRPVRLLWFSSQE